MDALPVRSTRPMSNLSLDQSRQVGGKPTMDQVGKAFETLFMQTIMKSMRDAQIDGGLLDSEHEKPFQSMLDGAYSELAVKTTKLGLAEAISRQFEPKTGNKALGIAPGQSAKLTHAGSNAHAGAVAANIATGQTLALKSILGSGLPMSQTLPGMAPSIVTGD